MYKMLSIVVSTDIHVQNVVNTVVNTDKHAQNVVNTDIYVQNIRTVVSRVVYNIFVKQNTFQLNTQFSINLEADVKVL